MRGAISRAVEGRGGLVVAVVALVAALSGSAIALPGSNRVDSGDIKNGVVGTKDMKIAYLHVNHDSQVVRTKGVTGHDFIAGGEVLCLNLKFKPKTGSATRAEDNLAGGDFTAPIVGLSQQATLYCDAPFTDATLKVPDQAQLKSTYAQFFG